MIKPAVYVLASLLLVASYVGTHINGINKGEQKIEAIRTVEREQRSIAIKKEELKYAKLEGEHSALIAKVDKGLIDAKKEHDEAIASAQRDYADSLRKSETRAGVYKRKAEGGAVERNSLAEHAAKLDKALEEGRSLEREYRAAVEQRDTTIENLAELVKADRKLINTENK